MAGEPAHWPHGVKKITIDQFEHMGVDSDGRLYWKGKKVAYRLAGAERAALFITAGSALMVGIESAINVVCRFLI